MFPSKLLLAVLYTCLIADPQPELKEEEELVAERAMDHHREDRDKSTLFDENRAEVEAECHRKCKSAD